MQVIEAAAAAPLAFQLLALLVTDPVYC